MRRTLLIAMAATIAFAAWVGLVVGQAVAPAPSVSSLHPEHRAEHAAAHTSLAPTVGGIPS